MRSHIKGYIELEDYLERLEYRGMVSVVSVERISRSMQDNHRTYTRMSGVAKNSGYISPNCYLDATLENFVYDSEQLMVRIRSCLCHLEATYYNSLQPRPLSVELSHLQLH